MKILDPGTTQENGKKEEALLIIKNIKEKSFDANGNISHEGQAQSASYFQEKNIVKIDKPYFIFKNKEQIWVITAQKGVLSDKGKKLILLGKVNLHSKTKNQTLLTEKLIIHTKTQKIETDAPIEYKENGINVHATGIQADLHEQTLSLNQVKGHYVKTMPDH